MLTQALVKKTWLTKSAKSKSLNKIATVYAKGALPAHNLHALSINNLTGVFLLVHKTNTIGILLYVA